MFQDCCHTRFSLPVSGLTVASFVNAFLQFLVFKTSDLCCCSSVCPQVLVPRIGHSTPAVISVVPRPTGQFPSLFYMLVGNLHKVSPSRALTPTPCRLLVASDTEAARVGGNACSQQDEPISSGLLASRVVDCTLTFLVPEPILTSVRQDSPSQFDSCAPTLLSFLLENHKIKILTGIFSKSQRQVAGNKPKFRVL